MHVIVSNEINNQSIITSFNVFHEVADLTVNMLKESVEKGINGTVVVKMRKGTNVTIDILFEDDGATETLFIPEADTKEQQRNHQYV